MLRVVENAIHFDTVQHPHSGIVRLLARLRDTSLARFEPGNHVRSYVCRDVAVLGHAEERRPVTLPIFQNEGLAASGKFGIQVLRELVKLILLGLLAGG